jgi:phage shock protein E
VDVRSAQQYAASHVKGAISIPLDEIDANPTGLKLEKDQWIITYCV